MKRGGSGFTLIELMVAITITAALVLICSMMIKMIAEGHQKISSTVKWQREANLLVELITDDLNAAHTRTWHQSTKSDSCMVGWYVLKPATTQSEESAVGDLCAVGYTMRQFRADSDMLVNCVIRIQRDSGEVFRAIEDDREISLWDLDGENEIVAEGILDVELRPLSLGDLGVWQTWEAETGGMPEAVELHLVMASSAMQKRFQTAEDWNWLRVNYQNFDRDEIKELRHLIRLGIHDH